MKQSTSMWSHDAGESYHERAGPTTWVSTCSVRTVTWPLVHQGHFQALVECDEGYHSSITFLRVRQSTLGSHHNGNRFPSQEGLGTHLTNWPLNPKLWFKAFLGLYGYLLWRVVLLMLGASTEEFIDPVQVHDLIHISELSMVRALWTANTNCTDWKQPTVSN